MTDAEAETMLAALREHYREPPALLCSTCGGVEGAAVHRVSP